MGNSSPLRRKPVSTRKVPMRRGDTGLAKAMYVLVMRGTEAIWAIAWRAMRPALLPACIKRHFSSSIEENDVLILKINSDDRIHRRLKNAAQTCRATRQHLVGTHALGDIAQDDGVELVRSLAGMRNRSFDGELLAVRTQAIQHHVPVHAPRGRAGTAEMRHMLTMRLAKAFRHQHIERLPDNACARMQKHLLGGVVVKRDALRRVDNDDGIHRRLDDALRQQPQPVLIEFIHEYRPASR